jgi:hypothetical protein
VKATMKVVGKAMSAIATIAFIVARIVDVIVG